MTHICRFWTLSLLKTLVVLGSCFGVPEIGTPQAQAADELRSDAIEAMKRATTYFREHVATNGGYVYYYSPDLKRRLGEGVATDSEVWVQPPGTPAVGLAFLSAYRATGDAEYLEAAREVGTALVYGQLKSGGWQNSININPRGQRLSQYRNGNGGVKNYSTLDDGISQTAIQFMVELDGALAFRDPVVSESATIAMDSLLNAQFPNGAFPQVWSEPVQAHELKRASYPKYDWRTENRVKEYWDLYTLNDDSASYVAQTLLSAYRVYDDVRYLRSLRRLGDFLILAQMPDPQPAWAQQYNFEMQPSWARKFEPPAIAGRESQDAIRTLMIIYLRTGDDRFLKPIPKALDYLKRSELSDGQLARYYELESNKPLYMTRDYKLTHDDSRIPTHYGWKTESEVDELRRLYDSIDSVTQLDSPATDQELEASVRQIIDTLDGEGRWMSSYDRMPLVGQPKFRDGELYLSTAVFNLNLKTISDFLQRDAIRK